VRRVHERLCKNRPIHTSAGTGCHRGGLKPTLHSGRLFDSTLLDGTLVRQPPNRTAGCAFSS
jgi:hypothetical protein